MANHAYVIRASGSGLVLPASPPPAIQVLYSYTLLDATDTVVPPAAGGGSNIASIYVSFAYDSDIDATIRAAVQLSEGDSSLKVHILP